MLRPYKGVEWEKRMPAGMSALPGEEDGDVLREAQDK